jgi:hypothetical protein
LNINSAFGILIGKYHKGTEIDRENEIRVIIEQHGYNYDEFIQKSKEEMMQIQESEKKKHEKQRNYKKGFEKLLSREQRKEEHKKEIEKFCENIVEKLIDNKEFENFITNWRIFFTEHILHKDIDWQLKVHSNNR